jgi:hypothetical protein
VRFFIEERDFEPRSHGNYLPALSTLHQLLRRQGGDSGDCIIHILFLSDGRPSDAAPKGPGSVEDKKAAQIIAQTVDLLSPFCSTRRGRFKLHTVGFGNEDFEVLRQMASAIPHDGGCFHATKLNMQSLKSTISSFSSSITQSLLNSESGE